MEPTLTQRLITELRLSLATRRSELAVFAVALLIGSVFVTTRLLETPIGAPSTAGETTPTSTPLISPTPVRQNVTPAAFRERFGGLELSPLPTQPLLGATPTLIPTATPTATVAPTAKATTTPAATPTTNLTPSPTPRTNPWAPYIP